MISRRLLLIVTFLVLYFNKQNLFLLSANLKVIRPFVEYENVKYILFSPEKTLSDHNIKRKILENLPDGVIAVIYYNENKQLDDIKELTKDILPNKYIIKKINSKGETLWARDALPYPVVINVGGYINYALVGSKYFQYFEPDVEISKFFKSYIFEHDYLFEGGNLIADIDGTCFTTDKYEDKKIDAFILARLYGCKKLITFPVMRGIGHIDERLKILPNKIALTDTNEYISVLENLGYKIYLFPKPYLKFGSYLNSLIINNIIFMPTFDDSKSDEEAKNIYENLGFKVILLDSYELTDDAYGSIHCITFGYPDFLKFR